MTEPLVPGAARACWESGTAMITADSLSEPGGHLINEDARLVRMAAVGAGSCICAVADGQGGRAGGREAAETAVRVAVEHASLLSGDQLSEPLAWPTILRQADMAVHNASEAGYTTLVGLAVVGTTVSGYCVRDEKSVERGLGHTVHEGHSGP